MATVQFARVQGVQRRVCFWRMGSGLGNEESGREKGPETRRNPGDDLRRVLYKEEPIEERMNEGRGGREGRNGQSQPPRLGAECLCPLSKSWLDKTQALQKHGAGGPGIERTWTMRAIGRMELEHFPCFPSDASSRLESFSLLQLLRLLTSSIVILFMWIQNQIGSVCGQGWEVAPALGPPTGQRWVTPLLESGTMPQKREDGFIKDILAEV